MGNETQGTGQAVILRDERGHFLPGTRPNNLITSETARTMRERRKELTAQKLRQELAKRGRVLNLDEAAGPSAVMAAAAGQMFEEIVANKDANPRYRAETWQMIGRHAGLLGDNRESAQSDGVNITIGADLAREIVQKILDARSKPD